VSLSLGVLVSGSGSNLQAILDAVRAGQLKADVRIVVSNRPGVRALLRAKEAGVEALVVDHREFATRESFDARLVAELKLRGVEWLALAGFMRVITPVLLEAFRDRIVNIHPSLLPAFPGVDSQTQAFRYGVKVAGCTVHFVDQGVDSGPIIAQRAVPVLETDDEESLRCRILAQEHELFPEVLQAISEDRVRVVRREGQRPLVTLAGRAEAQ
jgi:phosphoribosylglycinamide formyltransferase 1